MISQDAVIAANRFGFGADPDAMSTVAKDPKAWVKRQIVPEKQLPAPLADLPSTMDDQMAFFLWLRDYRKEIQSTDEAMKGSVEKSYVKALYPRHCRLHGHAGFRAARPFLVQPLRRFRRKTSRDCPAAVVRARCNQALRHRQVRRHAARRYEASGDADLPR
jgi:hypothetical protein